MSIGKCMITISVLLVLGGCISQPTEGNNAKDSNKATYAWWLTHNFQPIENDLKHLKVKNIKKIKLLKNNDLVQIKGAIKEIENSNLSFRQEFDLNKDGIKEVFEAGVYEDYQGNTGTLILITQNEQVIDVLIHEGKPQFNALYLEEGKLMWFDCMQCDNYGTIKFSSGSYYLW